MGLSTRSQHCRVGRRRQQQRRGGALYQRDHSMECLLGHLRMGVSIRVTNDNEQCKSQQQQRLCLIRPCHLDDSSTAAGLDCRRSTWRAAQRIKLQYGECESDEKFRLKYCSACRRNRCCSPRRSTTVNVQFRCPDDKLIIERFMEIHRCECRATTNCPYTVQYDDDYDDAADDVRD